MTWNDYMNESDPMALTAEQTILNRLSFNDYQTATEETAIYPDAGHGTVTALAYVGLGLGEAGEIQGKIKKVMRDTDGATTPEAREAILAEVGDLLWYCARLCRELDTSLARVAMGNLQKLRSRKDRGVLKGSGDTR